MVYIIEMPILDTVKYLGIHMDCRLTGKSQDVVTLEQIKLKLLNLNWLIRCKSKDKKLLIYDYHDLQNPTLSCYQMWN